MVAIKKLEKDLLFTQKRKEGKTIEEAKEEIDRDIEFNFKTTRDIKSLNSKLQNLEKENLALLKKLNESTKQIKDLNKKLLVKGLKDASEGSGSIDRDAKIGGIYILRVIRLFKENLDKPLTKTQIIENCMIDASRLKEVIILLKAMDLIVEGKDYKGLDTYILKKL